MKPTPATPEPILIECDLPDPPEKVWRALTEPELLGQWLMPCNLRPEVGTRFQFQPRGAEGADRAGGTAPADCVDGTVRTGTMRGAADDHAPIDCEMLEVEPQRRLRWVQREQGDSASGSEVVESFVTVELSSVPNGGTHLRLIHDGFASVSRRGAPGLMPHKAGVTELKPRSAKAQPIKACSANARGGVHDALTDSRPVCLLRRAA